MTHDPSVAVRRRHLPNFVEEEKCTRGRPTLYRPEFTVRAREHCRGGARLDQLAGLLGVAPRSIDNWIARIPEFAAAVREARAVADAKVARCLYERAVGYQHTVERTVWHLGRERSVTEKVHLPPDTRACIFWLRNRQPQYWSGRAAAPEGDTVDLLALLDAAGERARRVRSTESS